MRKHLRHFYRTMAAIKLMLNSNVKPVEYVCTVVDISAGGIRFTADFKFDVGAKFILLQPKCEHGILELYGEIVWRSELEYHIFQYGARLYNRDGSTSEELKAEVRKIRDTNLKSMN